MTAYLGIQPEYGRTFISILLRVCNGKLCLANTAETMENNDAMSFTELSVLRMDLLLLPPLRALPPFAVH